MSAGGRKHAHSALPRPASKPTKRLNAFQGLVLFLIVSGVAWAVMCLVAFALHQEVGHG